MVLEKDFQKQVIKMIKHEFPSMWFYKASDRFITGIPDIVGCCAGRMWAVELKVQKNKPTELQQYTMEKMRAAGALVIWSNDIEEIRRFLWGVARMT